MQINNTNANFGGVGSAIQEQVEVFVSCRELANVEVFGKSEPKIQLYYLTADNGYDFFGETEAIKNTVNPDFAKSFVLNYDFEHRQGLMFHIGDVNKTGRFDIIGDVKTSLAQLMGAKNQTSIFDIRSKSGRFMGKLIVRCELIKQCNEWLYLEGRGINIQQLGGCLCFVTPTNPFLNLFRSEPDGSFVKAFETEDCPNNLNPIWKGFEVSVQHLANGDHKRNIKMAVHSRNGQTENYIGECILTIDDLLELNKRKFEIRSNRTQQPKGTISFTKVVLNIKPTFLDYIRGGVQLQSILAIDFTASNGESRHHHSLHALRPNHRNHYQKALDGVMDVLIHYDNNQTIAMYGFGATLHHPNMRSTTAMHCFPCTFDTRNPFVTGLDQMELVYQNTLQYISLSGPTYFAPILRETMAIVQQRKNRGSIEYSILIIMTDGQINDMKETTDCLVESATLPLSVIIVGIGHADFTNMEILDADYGDLRHSNGQISIREIVQFVPFSRFKHDHEALARHVLAKIPDQLTAYYRLMNIPPNPPQQFISIDNNNIGIINSAMPTQFNTATTINTTTYINQNQFGTLGNPGGIAMPSNLNIDNTNTGVGLGLNTFINTNTIPQQQQQQAFTFNSMGNNQQGQVLMTQNSFNSNNLNQPLLGGGQQIQPGMMMNNNLGQPLLGGGGGGQQVQPGMMNMNPTYNNQNSINLQSQGTNNTGFYQPPNMMPNQTNLANQANNNGYNFAAPTN